MFDPHASQLPANMDAVRVIQAFDAAWNARDVESVLQFFNPDSSGALHVPIALS